ncbi:MAG: Ig-like domain-containing protein [Deltaproteobacteria bacterium]|nr:Ig-like domain-containing protein [Deltaproteobacteria bacterium]
MRVLAARSLALSSLLQVAGCFVDDVAPAAPLIDAPRAFTSLETVTVSGTAEFLSTVVISAGSSEATAAADPQSGRFVIDVPLADGKNDLVIVATDADGNASEATRVTVVREPPRAEIVRLSIPNAVTNADSGALDVIVDVDNDEAEIDLATLAVTLRLVDYAGAFTDQPLTLDRSGHATFTIGGLSVADTGRVVVEADIPDGEGIKAADEASFTVLPGAPALVDVQLAATVAGAPIGPAAEISVPADTDVDVTVTVSDAHDNLVVGAPVRIDALGSGARVLGTRIVNATLAGTFEVLAEVAGGVATGTARLTIVAAADDHLELVVDAAAVEAGTPVTAIARVVDVFGNTVTDAIPGFSIDAPQAFAAPLVVAGVATAVVVVTTAGGFLITAADPDSPAAAATAPLQVVAAVPVNGDFVEIDPAGLPYGAGDPVLVNYELLDAFGNVNTSVPVIVTVNAPNVSVADDGAGVIEINGIVRAGSYLVRARAVGTGLPDDIETLVIDPNPADAGFNLLLSSGLIAERGTLIFTGTDGFGNLIDESAVVTTFSDPTAVTRVGNQLTFDRPGTFSILACLIALPAVCDTEFVSVQGLVDTVPPTVSVTVEAPATPDVATNGLIVFRADVSDDRSLSELRFVATFGDIGACTRSGGPVLFPGGTTSTSRTFSFNVPGCAIPLDVVDIVVQATDEAGNVRNGSNNSLTIRDPFLIDFPNDPGAFVVSIAAFRNRLDVPQDVVVDPSTAQLTITNNGDDRAIIATIDRAQFDLRDIGGNRVDLPQVRGAAISAAGHQFFATDDAGNNGDPGIVRVSPDLVVDTFVDTTSPGGQAVAVAVPIRGVVVEETGVPALCMAARDQDRVYCYSNLAGVGATRLAETGTGANTRPLSLAIDAPDAAGDVDVLFVAFDQTRIIRPFAFNATRTTLSAIAGGDISLAAEVQAAELGDLVVGPPPSENLYVAHRSNGRILKVDRSVDPPTVSVFADGFTRPVGLAFDAGSLLVVDESDEAVFRLSPDPVNPGQF